jgi:hypothetical protein
MRGPPDAAEKKAATRASVRMRFSMTGTDAFYHLPWFSRCLRDKTLAIYAEMDRLLSER